MDRYGLAVLEFLVVVWVLVGFVVLGWYLYARRRRRLARVSFDLVQW